MNQQEFAVWTTKTQSSSHQWVEDDIFRQNGRGAMYYIGGEDGLYMKIASDGLLTAGDYKGAVPHIGEALFTVEAQRQYSDYNEAFTAALSIGGQKFLMDMFSGDTPSPDLHLVKGGTESADAQHKPLYPHTAAYAHEHGELNQYREGIRLNRDCAAAIDIAVRASNYELYRYDLAGAAKSVVAEHGFDRTAWVLANVIRRMDYDGRISQKHKQWAQEYPIPDGYKADFYLDTHPAVLDGFIDHARQEIDNHLRAAEISTEQNYNLLDGRINNEPAPHADLTDGQTHEEIAELAPETLPDPEGRPSLLEQLAQLKEHPPVHTSPNHSGHDGHER
ncbi:DUF3849 domain-containing protein [Ruminococcaceae bacterium OttesenSCG-928-L11]|nr:DUF3849 domain-containing protein [Ruminococcaceae bacterium OttesenSCG-928-L11]